MRPSRPSPDSTSRPSADTSPPLKQQLQQELGGEVSVGEEIGRGQLTAIFRGVETKGQRPVEIHVVPPALASIERGVVDRLLRAARAVAKLRHPRINPVLRVAAGDRLAWFVTRLPEGEPLQQLLERDWQMPLDRVVAITGHIATALGCAHEHGVFHGDFTPASVIVDQHDGVTVRDFGISRAARSMLSGKGADQGRYYYQAPELDGPAVHPLAAAGVEGLLTPASPAADQYALAVTTYQMLTGSLPFMGSTPEAVRHEHQVAQVPPLAVARPDLPVALSTVLERALSKNPADRFPSVTRFAAAFRLAAQGRPSPTQAVSRRSGDTLFFPDPPSGRLRPTAMRNALAACAATALLVLLAWQTRHAAWSSDTVNGRLVAPMPDRVETVTAYGQSLPARTFPPPDERPAEPARPAEEEAPPPAPGREPERRRAENDGLGSVGFLTLGTNPVSTIYINGVAAPTNPVRNWTVTPGRVFLRFEMTDSGGVVVRDTSVVVPAGETVNLGFVRIGSQQ